MNIFFPLWNNNPLDQFTLRNFLSVKVDILNNNSISFTNMALYLSITTFIIMMLYLLAANYNLTTPNSWSLSVESIYATVYSIIIISQINSNLDNTSKTFSVIHVDFSSEYFLAILFCIIHLFIEIYILFVVGKKKGLEGGLKLEHKNKNKSKSRDRGMEVRLSVFSTPGRFWPLDAASALATNSKCYNVGIRVYPVGATSNARATDVMRGCLSDRLYRNHYQLGPTSLSGIFNPTSNNSTVTFGVDVREDSGGCYSYIRLPTSLQGLPGGLRVTSNNRPIRFVRVGEVRRDEVGGGFSAKVYYVTTVHGPLESTIKSLGLDKYK